MVLNSLLLSLYSSSIIFRKRLNFPKSIHPLLRSLNKTQELPLVDGHESFMNHDNNAWFTTEEFMIFLRLILLLVFALACGRYKESNPEESEEVIKIDGSNIQGVYTGTLYAMNINTTIGNIGAAGVHRSYDSFKAFVKIYLGDMGVIHRQTIHLGSRCPTIRDDINGDGYVDLRETIFAVGNIIIPLDGDIDTQVDGSGWSPQGNGIAGGYFYERTASFSRMFEDLRELDTNSIDEVEKLPYDQGMSMENRVVLILGVGTQMRLPDSIQTLGGMTRHRSLPIACGVLKHTNQFPAELYDHSDPAVTNPRTVPRPRINPRTPEHREPTPNPRPRRPDEITPLPDPDPQPPRRGGARSRINCWFSRSCLPSK
jgi:hypothetical protein